MRFFIALEIPSENLASFQDIQAKLQTLIPQARLTDPDKIHLTLTFIGEQKDNFKPDLTNIIEVAAKDISPFKISPGSLDGFPSTHHPACIWVGVKGDVDKIFFIRERIRDGLEKLGFPVDERRFIPHITIAKLNNNFQINRNLEAKLANIMTSDFAPIQITSIKLIESAPQNGFHKHHTLAEIKLIANL